ncbi:sensor histidine kinase [Clostridium sp. OM07-10AC]|nr:sensor histidine kinase [Clostridium sp. OM07-10AC]
MDSDPGLWHWNFRGAASVYFRKFYTSKLRQNQNGTGLGLMIAKQIALRHGGDISVESQPGEGTTFYFSFTECSVEDAEAL